MRAERRTAKQSAWTIMLADVVALMLAFFVLGLSMRVIVPPDGAPLIEPATPEAAMAALEGWSAQSLTTAQRPSDPTPPFAYLATILGRMVANASADAIRYDDQRLRVTLQASPLLTDETAGRMARNLLLAMAFLARRFDLDLSVTMASPDSMSLEAQVDQSRKLQAWLSGETRHRAPTVIFVPSLTDIAADRQMVQSWHADVQRRPRSAREAAAP